METRHEIVQKCLPTAINGVCLKPLTLYLKLISRKWMIFIIMVLPRNSTPLRYSEIKNRIKALTSEKISDTTLSSRLNELLDYLIVERKQYNEIPPRVEYKLSPKGVHLQESLQPLITWAINDCHQHKIKS
ncbi:MAG: winged helix-turn-helix transcriptional regulator [Candidatus Hodarchaeota archaeon]